MEDSGEDDGYNMSMFYHPHCDEKVHTAQARFQKVT